MKLNKQKIMDELAQFVPYGDAELNKIYAWYDLKHKKYVVFIAMEITEFENIKGLALYDSRGYTCPHIVIFTSSFEKNFLLDLNGHGLGDTLYNIDEFIESFEKEVNHV